MTVEKPSNEVESTDESGETCDHCGKQTTAEHLPRIAIYCTEECAQAEGVALKQAETRIAELIAELAAERDSSQYRETQLTMTQAALTQEQERERELEAAAAVDRELQRQATAAADSWCARAKELEAERDELRGKLHHQGQLNCTLVDQNAVVITRMSGLDNEVERLTALVADSSAFKRQLAGLIHKWLGEQMKYPDTEAGNHAAAAIRLCAKELGDVLNPPQPAPYDHISKANPDEDPGPPQPPNPMPRVAEAIASRFIAGDGIDELADDYDLEVVQVEAAIRTYGCRTAESGLAPLMAAVAETEASATVSAAPGALPACPGCLLRDGLHDYGPSCRRRQLKAPAGQDSAPQTLQDGSGPVAAGDPSESGSKAAAGAEAHTLTEPEPDCAIPWGGKGAEGELAYGGGYIGNDPLGITLVPGRQFIRLDPSDLEAVGYVPAPQLRTLGAEPESPGQDCMPGGHTLVGDGLDATCSRCGWCMSDEGHMQPIPPCRPELPGQGRIGAGIDWAEVIREDRAEIAANGQTKVEAELAKEEPGQDGPEPRPAGCSCGIQWPCPLHGGPPKPAEPDPPGQSKEEP